MTSTFNEFTRPLAGLMGAKPSSPAWFDWAIAQPSEERMVEVDGATIRYSAWGDPSRRGVVFIHGGRAHRNWWRPFAPHFAKHFRVVAFDLSGLGDSGWRPKYSMTGFVNELFAVIDHAELTRGGRPIVVGHSFGGWVTLTAVEQRGERLSGAVIIDSPIVAPDPDEGYTILRANPGMEPTPPKPPRIYPRIEEPIERFRFLPDQACDQLYLVDYIARQGLVEVGADGARGWRWKFDPAQGANFEIHFERNLFLAARCPLAFIYGEESIFASGPGFDHLVQQTRGRTPFILVPSAHHHLMMEHPIGFVATLRALLNCWPVRVGV